MNHPLTIIVTGATGAIGNAAVQALRSQGHNVIATSRRPDHQGFYPLDISNPDSINSFVQSLTNQGIRIDALLNNAGTLLPSYSTTPQGFERVTATNYLGTYLLTRQLLPLFNPGAHIVCTVSLTCHFAHVDRNFLNLSPRNYSQLGTYANSKFAVALFAQELQRRYPDRLVVNLTDPGIVNSRMLSMHRWFDPLADLFFRPFTKSPAKGAQPALNALAANCSLQLFRGRSHSNIPRRWIQPDLAAWLWQQTEQLVMPQSSSQSI